jgi:hypothetical protein
VERGRREGLKITISAVSSVEERGVANTYTFLQGVFNGGSTLCNMRRKSVVV